MREQTQDESIREPLESRRFDSGITGGLGIPRANPEAGFLPSNAAMQHERSQRLKQAIGDLKIGQRIHYEIKAQGRSVAWLARQLNMERTSLYYTFRQNSIDVEMLMRISFHLNHDFLQDMADVYKAHGL